MGQCLALPQPAPRTNRPARVRCSCCNSLNTDAVPSKHLTCTSPSVLLASTPSPEVCLLHPWKMCDFPDILWSPDIPPPHSLYRPLSLPNGCVPICPETGPVLAWENQHMPLPLSVLPLYLSQQDPSPVFRRGLPLYEFVFSWVPSLCTRVLTSYI